MLWGFWYPALRSDQLRGRKLSARCCSRCLWYWVAIPPESLSRCATSARTALFRYRSATSTAPTSSAPITAGNSTRTRASAAMIPSLTADSKLKCERIYAGSFPCEERDGYIWVFMANPEGRAAGDAPAPSAPGAADVQPALPNRASLGRSALQRRPGHHRPDGPGARPLRPPGVVVAHAPQHPRQSQAVRADPQRLSHESARAFGQ